MVVEDDHDDDTRAMQELMVVEDDHEFWRKPFAGEVSPEAMEAWNRHKAAAPAASMIMMCVVCGSGEQSKTCECARRRFIAEYMSANMLVNESFGDAMGREELQRNSTIDAAAVEAILQHCRDFAHQTVAKMRLDALR